MRTLYVTELDGTLLNEETKLNPYSVETINGLVEREMLFSYEAVCSLVSASVVAAGLPVRIPVIVYRVELPAVDFLWRRRKRFASV